MSFLISLIPATLKKANTSFSVNFRFDQPSADKVNDLISPYDFEQSVTESTHNCHKLGHILDWILFWKSDDIVETTTVSYDLTSDHYDVLFDLNIPKPYPPVTTVCGNIHGIDIVAVHSDITHAVLFHPDLSIAAYNTESQAVLDTHASASTRKTQPNRSAPWFTTEVANIKREH